MSRANAMTKAIAVAVSDSLITHDPILYVDGEGSPVLQARKLAQKLVAADDANPFRAFVQELSYTWFVEGETEAARPHRENLRDLWPNLYNLMESLHDKPKGAR